MKNTFDPASADIETPPVEQSPAVARSIPLGVVDAAHWQAGGELDDYTERLYERADRLHDERRDAAWEKALERDDGPWDRVDAFNAAKEHEFFENQKDTL
jgi:hypothetical protein